MAGDGSVLSLFEQKAHLFDEFSYEAIALFDENLICQEMNSAVTRLLQYSREEFIGQHALLMVAPEDHYKINLNVKLALSVPYELKMVRKDGSTFTGLVQGRNVDIDGRYLRVTTCRDISDIKDLENRVQKKTNQFESIFHNTLVGILVTDKNRNILRANDAMARMVGYESAEVGLRHPLKLSDFHVSEEAANHFAKIYSEELLRGGFVKSELQIRRCDGSTTWASVIGNPVSSEVPPNLDEGIVWVLEDISEIKAAEAKMAEAFDELETIFNNALVGILVVDGNREIYKVNQTFVDMVGQDSPQDWIGRSVREFHLSDEAYEEFGQNFFYPLTHHQVHEIDYQVKGKDGKPIWVSVTGKAIDKNIPADLSKGVVWVSRDISQRKKMEEQLLQLTRKDPLTETCNRRYFRECCLREIEVMKRFGHPVSLLMMDLDNFKNINDIHGHDVGDKALCVFSEICRQTVRTVDVVGRWGGEEFAVLLPETSLSAAVRVAERIRHEVMTGTVGNGVLPIMTVSVGAVELSAEETFDNALKRADVLLYKAKEQGRNQVVSG